MRVAVMSYHVTVTVASVATVTVMRNAVDILHPEGDVHLILAYTPNRHFTRTL